MRNAPKFPTPPEGADLFTWIVRVAAEVRAARQGQAAIGHHRMEAMAPALAPFVARGLAAMDGDALRILPDGRPYARTIAALFDPYRQDSVRRFSSAV